MKANEIRLGQHCNQNCVFCNSSKHVEALCADRSAVEARIATAAREGVQLLVFSGGEPTLYRELPAYVRAAKQQGIDRVEIQTNGVRLVYPAYARRLAEAGLDGALVSLHSMNEPTIDVITRTTGGLRNTLEGIRNLLDLGIEVEVNHVVNAHNYRELSRFVTALHDRFGRSCRLLISFVAPTGNAEDNPTVVPRLSDVGGLLGPALDLLGTYQIDHLVVERCGIPLCIMPGYEERHETVSLSAAPDHRDKIKPPTCDQCRWDQRCAGVWRRYAQIHGTGELVPQ